jgi:hypothetical protein
MTATNSYTVLDLAEESMTYKPVRTKSPVIETKMQFPAPLVVAASTEVTT